MRFAMSAVTVLLLVACTPPAERPAEAPEAAAEAQTSPFTGQYIAISTTAMSITGDMDVTADVLSFSKGFRVEGGAISSDLTGDTDLSAGGGTVNDGSGMQVTEIELRRIDNTRVAADAANPSLCGEGQASYLILGRAADRVTVQVFSGADAPGPNAHDTQLCGILNYATP